MAPKDLLVARSPSVASLPKPRISTWVAKYSAALCRPSKGALLERRRGLKLLSDLTDFRPVPLQIPLQRSFTGFLYKKRRPKGRQDKRLGQRRGDREAEGAALEMPCTGNGTAGLNPALSAGKNHDLANPWPA